MPKATSKKKKYNARFPPARIKKIMQMDEEVGKVAAAVPVIISRALEMFIESLVTETSKVTRAKNAKTLSTSHIKQTITGTKQFDFLRDLVQNVPDHQADDNGESSFERDPPVQKRARGRPRSVEGFSSTKSRGNKATSDEEDDDDDDAEDTETDDESTDFRASHPADVKPNASHLPGAQPNVSYAPSLQQPNVKPNNIDQLLQAASSLQQQQYHHSPHLPPASDNALSQTKNNNNNNYVPSSAAGSASLQDLSVIGSSYISGNNVAPVLHHQGLPLSSDSVPPSSLSEMKQPLYQMPSNLDSPLPSHCTPKLPINLSYYNSSNNRNPSYIQSPVSQKLLQQQHQPIDLSSPLRQNLQVEEEDDYDT